MLHVFPDAAELSLGFTNWLSDRIATTLSSRDRFTIALSGGSTPTAVFRLLASEAFSNKIEWSKIHFFWGDERFVPFADERNNARTAFLELLDKVPVNREQIHIMPTDMDPATASTEYEAILHRYFDGIEFSFDLVMLGMGDDGHTLSLFPGYPVVHETEKWVTAFFLEQQDMFRITLTSSIVNKAAAVAFLVAGAGKSSPLSKVIEGKFDPDRYPSQVIRPIKGELHWFVDEAAASGLQKR